MFSSAPKKTLDERVLAASQSIVKENMGILFGDIYIIKISPDLVDAPLVEDKASKMLLVTFDKAREILDYLDGTEGGRGAPTANFLLSGNFLLSRADENAIHHYHVHARSLHRPIAYMEHMFNEINEAFGDGVMVNVQYTMRKITRDAIAKGLFNLSVIPHELDVALSKFYMLMEDAFDTLEKSLTLKLSAGFTVAKAFLSLSPYYADIKKTYAENIAKFLLNQSSVVLKELHDVANDVVPTNIITLSIMELIKEDKPELRAAPQDFKAHLSTLDVKDVCRYLARPEMIALPAGVVASENLTIVFHNALLVLQRDPDMREKLHQALKALFGDTAFSTDNLKQVKELFEQDERDNGYLHRFYLELLRREHIGKTPDHLRLESNALRYTKSKIRYGDYEIPAGSNIVFLPAFPRFDERLYPNPDAFDPDRYLQDDKNLTKYPLTIFTEAKRRCPAHAVTSYIAKMFLSHLLLHYDFNLEKVNANDVWPTRLAVTPKANVMPKCTN